ITHRADLAVYRAKLQGRNRVVATSDDGVLAQPETRAERVLTLPEEDVAPVRPLPTVPEIVPSVERRAHSRPHAHRGPRFLWIGWPLAGLVFAVGGLGIAAGIAGALMGQHLDVIGLIAIVALVGAGQALSIEVERTGSISVSAVGALAGAAIIG